MTQRQQTIGVWVLSNPIKIKIKRGRTTELMTTRKKYTCEPDYRKELRPGNSGHLSVKSEQNSTIHELRRILDSKRLA